jgi:hypothetical protein
MPNAIDCFRVTTFGFAGPTTGVQRARGIINQQCTSVLVEMTTVRLFAAARTFFFVAICTVATWFFGPWTFGHRSRNVLKFIVTVWKRTI